MIVEAIENYKSSLILHHLEKLVIAFRNKAEIWFLDGTAWMLALA